MQKKWIKNSAVFLRAMRAAMIQSLGRLTLWLYCHGVNLPWTAWAEQSVSTPTLERYRRRALVSQLRSQRFRIARGPFFLRSSLDSFFTFIRYMQFPTLLAIKVSAALCVCLLPFVLFFFIRIYLPVEKRIARVQPDLNMQVVHSSEAIIPQAVILSQSDSIQKRNSTAEQLGEDSFFSFRVLDARTSEGILIQGKGSAHEESRRGWRLSPASDLLFKFVPQSEQRVLRLRFRPIPNRQQPAQCKLQIMTDVGKVVFATTFDSRVASRHLLLKSPLTRNLQEKLMPDFAMNRATLSSSPMSLPMSAGEQNIRFRIERMDDKNDSDACSALIRGFELVGGRQMTSNPSSKRSLLFMIFNSLNTDVAGDPKLMPWFSRFLRAPNTLHFTQHHAVDVRQGESFKTLLGFGSNSGSSSAAEVAIAENFHLVEKLRSKGFRVVLLGSVDSATEQIESFVPDVTIKIDNATYEPRLVLAQMFNVLAEEGSSPLLIVVRLKGMLAPWRPYFFDLNLRDLFLGGDSRGVMDAMIHSHLKTLDRELSYHFSELEKIGLFKKMDLVVSAERGFDLGANLTSQEQAKPTFSPELLLNEETLRVPLGVSLADVPSEGLPLHLKNQNVISSHNDLSRSLWEGLGINDAKFPAESKRLWKRNDLMSSRYGRRGMGFKDTEFVMRMIPVRSKIQEGVLFADPDSAGGFLKYVSQPLPSRIYAPDAYGWPEKLSLNFRSGEQFRQVSRRGQKEEVIVRVNSRFVREARRVIRQERRFPLRLRITANSEQRLDLTFEEKSQGRSSLLPALRQGLNLTSTKTDPQTFVHRIVGMVSQGESFDINGSGNTFRVVENRGEGALVACPEALVFSAEALNSALTQKTVCLLETPEEERLAQLRKSGRKSISFWLVEDENQICKLQENSGSEAEDYSECLEAGPHEPGRR